VEIKRKRSTISTASDYPVQQTSYKMWLLNLFKSSTSTSTKLVSQSDLPTSCAIQATSFGATSASIDVHNRTEKNGLLFQSQTVVSCINTAFMLACSQGNVESVRKLLMDPQIDPSAEHNTAIRLAASNGHHLVVQELLKDCRVNPSDSCEWVNHDEALKAAAEKGHLEVVKLLLADKRVDPSADNNYAIRLASGNGHVDVVTELLKDRRVDPTAGELFQCNEALTRARSNSHTGVEDLLLKDRRVVAAMSKARHNSI